MANSDLPEFDDELYRLFSPILEKIYKLFVNPFRGMFPLYMISHIISLKLVELKKF